MAAGWRSGSGRGGRSNNCFVSSHNARLRASQGLTRRGLVVQSKLEQERYALLCRVPISEPYQICSCWSPTSSGANFTLLPPKSNFAFAHAAIRRWWKVEHEEHGSRLSRNLNKEVKTVTCQADNKLDWGLRLLRAAWNTSCVIIAWDQHKLAVLPPWQSLI